MRVPYTAANNLDVSLMPLLSFTLIHNERAIEVDGLLDTGATINVLPYSAGLALGADWNKQTRLSTLTGNLANYEARGLTVFAAHRDLPLMAPIRLIFAWTKADDIPVIFGQLNFFMEFDVCFYRSQQFFEINPKRN